MGRKSTFVPDLQSTATKSSLVPIDQIPADIKAEIDEAYQTLKTNPGRIHVEFDSQQERDAYLRYARSYCEQRDPNYRFRVSPVKGATVTQLDYRVSDPLTAEEIKANEVAAEKRRAARAAKEAAAPTA